MKDILYFITDMDFMSIKFALKEKKNKVGICLLQDAVYFACKGREDNKILEEAIKQDTQVFTSKRDVELRGLKNRIYPDVKILDYPEIIDLVLSYDRIINI